MKNIALLSLFAVLVTASLTVALGNAALFAVVPCLLLLLIAVEDYGPKRQRVQVRARLHNQNVDTRSSSHSLRLAA